VPRACKGTGFIKRNIRSGLYTFQVLIFPRFDSDTQI
jgi:hypothetical protein